MKNTYIPIVIQPTQLKDTILVSAKPEHKWADWDLIEGWVD